MRPATGLRLLIGAVLLLALAGLSAALATHASAGAVGTVFVNSVSNTDDGQCNGPPNDNAVGNCTLHEAIDQVNLGMADTIKFHPAVFSKLVPGVIQLDLGSGDLPIIEREVTIDNTGSAVVLDCDAQNDQTWDCGEGLEIFASHNGFDFKLIGGKQFTIREIAGDGIAIEGGIFSLGDIEISGVMIDVNGDGDGDAGIDIDDVRNVNHLVVTNSEIAAEDEGDDEQAAIRVVTDGTDLTNSNIEITDNRLYGSDGVQIRFFGDLYTRNGLNGAGHTINVDVSQNESITGDFGDGVEVSYCAGDPGIDGGVLGEGPGLGGDSCDARLSTINFKVRENGKISSNDNSDDGVRLDVQATQTVDCPVPCNDNVTVNLGVLGNAIIDSADDDGVDVNVDICCANSDSTVTVAVDDNQDIVGSANAVTIDQGVCCGGDNESHTSVSNNGELIAEGEGSGTESVNVNVHAGSTAGGPTDSDNNLTTVDVNGNGDFSGGNDQGVEIDATAGIIGGSGDADTNKTVINVRDNRNIDGQEGALSVEAFAGTTDNNEPSGDSNKNETIVNVTGNHNIDGAEGTGVKVQILSGADSEAPVNTTGDDNSTAVLVDNNDNIKGHGGDEDTGHAVLILSIAGGASERGARNSTSAVVTNNNNIIGQGGGDGVHTESRACCDLNGSNTNKVVVSGNHNITGNDGDGIDIHKLCCSTNTVTIQNNDGVIKGNQGQGILISACLDTSVADDVDELTLSDLACMGDSVTVLTITGNNVSNSGEDGMQICCGAFQFPLNQAPAGVAGVALKSVIADNTVSHNGEDGIDLDTTTGINIRHNRIFMNGTSATDGDNGIEIDWQTADDIWEGDNGVPDETFKVPAHFNRISENSIYDNVGLGINLIGIVSLDPLDTDPAAGTENGEIADGVGCIQFPATPIAANDCIPYPKIIFTGGVTVAKVSGSACANCIVEVFVADPTPADQTGPLGRQHGEGKTFLVSVHADALGTFSVNLPCGLAAGQLTATNTDKLKNTSEFASNIPFPGTPACAAATALPTDTPAPALPTNTPVPPANTPVPPAPTATAEPAGLCGDVNSDGLANSIDASLILQESAGLLDALPKGDGAGDVNVDGMTNAVDATLILQSAAAMIAGLGC